MNLPDNENLIDTDLIIDSAVKTHLKETAGWGKFLAIIGFVYSALIALGAIFAATIVAQLSGSYSARNEGLLAGGSVAIIYMGFAGIVFFMSMYLFRFAKKTQVALQSNDQADLTESFRNLKVYFRFAGIITVIALIFTILGVFGIMLASTFSR